MAKQASTQLAYSAAELEEFYRQMVFIRHFEEKTNFAYRQGKAGGYLHVYIGMEAIAVGWLSAIQKQDYVITAYRDHAHALLLGSDPVRVMAEIMGRSDGYSRGKGGSMHLYDIENNFFGGWGIVGAHTSLGTGLAFASRYRDEDRVTLCFLGDGAANAGQFFESMNMAGLWDLPIVYIIENNEFAMGTRLEYHAADTELHKRGYPFGLKHERLDGMDVIQVRKDAQRIVDQVRKDKKPCLIEIMSYRYAGHGAADNDRQLYRTREEEEEALMRDPLARLQSLLKEHKILTDEKIEAIEQEMVDRVEDIYEKALDSAPPAPEEVYQNVYTDMMPEVGH